MTGTSAPARRLTTSPIRPSGPATREIAAMTTGKPGGCWNDGIASPCRNASRSGPRA